jgi:bacterioferritin (cytochrome b1)
MDNRQIIAVLNELLSLESTSHLSRLREAEHYVSWPAAGFVEALRRIVAEDADHERWLVDEIRRLDGAPRPRRLGIRTAGDHYVDVNHLMPRIIEEERRLTQAYGRAGGAVSGPTSKLLATIQSRHERHAAELAEAHGDAAKDPRATNSAAAKSDKAEAASKR